MRRILAGLTAFLALLGVVLVLPVYAAPLPSPEAVPTSTEQVEMGSLADPAADATVEEGTTEPVAGVPADAPALTVTATQVGDFSLLGVTWAYDPAVTDTVVTVRVQSAEGTWGDWTEVGVEDADQDPSADPGPGVRGGTAPLWTGPSTAVEAQLVTRSGAQPTDVVLDLVDPGEGPVDVSPGAPAIQDTADAALAMPDVYSRVQWGADDSIRTWAPQYAPTIRAATVHHTADTNNYTADQVPAMMRSIYRFHTVSRGWGDIGYNVVVDKFGRRWEGRYGGLASTVVGAHAGGFNSGTFGVSMLGNYDTVPVPQVVVDSVAAIIAWKFSLYAVDPRGTVTLTSGGGGTSRYPAGAQVTLPTVFGHRDVGSTSCPGQYGYARMNEIRQRVAALVDSAVSPIESRYASDAGLRSVLGSAIGAEQASNGVSWQTYQRGRLYHSATTGVHLLRNGNLAAYLAAGGPSALGAPTTDELGTPDGKGVFNQFADAAVYWSAGTGSHIVHGAIRARWAAAGWEGGTLGYPTTDTLSVGTTGAMNGFQNGAVYWSAATGAQVVTGGLRGEWERRGGPTGPLGYPLASEVPSGAGGFGQSFQGGGLYWSAATGTHLVTGAIRAAWDVTGTGGGVLGYPTDEPAALPDGRGVTQTFSGGIVVWSPTTGAYPVTGRSLVAWRAAGAQGGRLGYPTGSPVATGATTVQSFVGGVLVAGAQGAQVVTGGIRATWAATGGAAGPLGLPRDDERAMPGGAGVWQPFEGGSLWWTPAGGTRVTTGAVDAWYRQTGSSAGRYGIPTGDLTALATNGGYAQQFSDGRAYWSPATGAHAVTGGIGTWWSGLGAERSGLGYPTTDERALSDRRGIVQSFSAGAVYWTASTGPRAVSGVILTRWQDLGSERGALGYPVGDMQLLGDGRGFSQQFEGGTLVWPGAGAATVVTNGIRALWAQTGAERGPLGYPVESERAAGGAVGVVQLFAGGRVYWGPTTGTRAVSGAILGAYLARGGEAGSLGLPREDMRPMAGGGYEQAFQGGTLHWNGARGAWV